MIKLPVKQRTNLSISVLEIRSPVAPELPIGTTGSSYIFEYFENAVTINSPSGSSAYTEPVCMLYSPAQVSIENAQERRSRTWFCIGGNELEDCLRRYSIPINQVLVGSFGSLSLIPFLQDVRRHIVQGRRYWEDEVDLLCRRFFRNLARTIIEKADRAIAPRPIQEKFFSVRHARACIHADLRRHWKTDEMAKYANLSPSYYRQMHASYFHITPMDDLIEARIRQAKLLLRFSSLTIDQIAEECGFSGAASFYRIFRKRCGTTPGEYVRAAQVKADILTPLPPLRRSLVNGPSRKKVANNEVSLLYGEPAGYWNFDVQDGLFDQDYRCRYEPMKLLHGARSAESPWGGSLNLDGKLAYGELAEAVLDTSESFTVCAWVVIREGRPAYDWMTAVSTGDKNHCSSYLQYCAADGRFAFTMTQSSTNFKTVHVRGTTRVAKNTWMHICGVYDRKSGVILLWENGVPVAVTRFDSAWTAAGPTRFGAGVYWGQITDFWLGSIAEVRLYARALDADEITQIYNHRQICAGMMEPVGGA